MPISKVYPPVMKELNPFKVKLFEIISHKGFRRYAASTSWLFAEQMLRIISGLFVGVWVARYLGLDFVKPD